MNKINVVLVDDNQSAIDDICDELRPFTDVRVVATFTDSALAMEYLLANPPDCVFLDMEMPEIHGLTLAERLQADAPEIVIVFLTAFSRYAQQAYEVDAEDYLLKPVMHERLALALSRVRAILDGREADLKHDLIVNLHNGFSMSMDGQEIPIPKGRARAILRYLFGNLRFVSRDRLVEELFYVEDEDVAASEHRMRNEIFRLRKLLEKLQLGIQIKYKNQCYCLSLSKKINLIYKD